MKRESISQDDRWVDNELDLRALCQALWSGKIQIISIVVMFILVSLGYSFLVKQEWSSTAITDKPTANLLGNYVLQQQFLRSLDQDISTQTQIMATPAATVMADVYDEFLLQLGAYDTRREFWLQSDYYKQRQVGEDGADAFLLDELIDKIQYTPRDDKKVFNESIKLIAETAADAAQLLRQYVVFASDRAVKNLNTELQSTWSAHRTALELKLQQRTAVATAAYQRQLNNLNQALKIAQQRNITQTQVDAAEDLPDAELFLLGQSMLQARLAALQAVGPMVNIDYDRDQELLASLKQASPLNEKFQAYRYLRTPEKPVKRDSPRRGFLVVLWGTIGLLVGAGWVLAHRIKRQPV